MKETVIYKNLRKVRNSMGLTIEEFSKLCGITGNSYQHKELGYQLSKNRCTRYYFYERDKERIANVVISWLFSEDEQGVKEFKKNKAQIYKSVKINKTAPKETYSRSEVEKIIHVLLNKKVGE